MLSWEEKGTRGSFSYRRVCIPFVEVADGFSLGCLARAATGDPTDMLVNGTRMVLINKCIAEMSRYPKNSQSISTPPPR